MYAPNCRNGQSTTGNLQLLRGSTTLDNIVFTDQLGYGYQYYSSLAAGTYTLRFRPTWTAFDVKDYTVSVYSKDKISILDSKGQTSNNDVSNVMQTLMNSLSGALSVVTAFTLENGGWYAIRRGYYGNMNTFFY